MKKSISFLVFSISTFILLSSCNQGGGAPVSEGGVRTSLTMTGSGLDAVAQSNSQKLFSFFIPSAVALTPPLLVDSTGQSINLNEAWVVIKEIEFEAQEVSDNDEQDGNEVEFEGPYFVDLLSDSPVSFGDAVVPANGIRRIKMKLHEAESLPAGVPLGLDSKSIYFSGSVNGINFTYAADDSTELEIGGPNPILPSSAKDMLVVIRMADLFKKIDLTSIISPTDIHAGNRVNVAGACPLIDASANDLYTCFRKALSTEGDFGNDDGDKDLGPEDDTVD